MRSIVLMFFCSFFLFVPVNGEGSIFISEILADPPPGIEGDSNNDGVTSSYDDEMIELFNSGSDELSLEGWFVCDSITTRHLFAEDSFIPSLGFLAIFAGGNPAIDNILWQVASSGSLSLNNTGDIISLYSDQGRLIDQVTYGGEANHDQSIAREELEKDAAFLLHSEIPSSGGRLFSPGTASNGNVYASMSVPEPKTIFYLFTSFIAILCFMAKPIGGKF